MTATNEPYGTTPLPTADDDGRPVRIWFDPEQTSSLAQQPQTQQIAVYESPLNEDCLNGNLLDINQHFCVYAVKNGLIRVLHRHSAMRTLLRGHAGQKVTDISFYLDGDVLGTVGHSAEKSSVLIWRVFEQSTDIAAELLLEISTSDFRIERILWHPFNGNQFWMIHSISRTASNGADPNIMLASLVETTKIQTVPHPTGTHALCKIGPGDCVMDGVAQLAAPNSTGGLSSDSSLSDLCWSGRETRHVLSVHDTGEIVLWDLRQLDSSNGTVSPSGASTATPKIISVIQQDEPLSRCFFLPHEKTVTQQPDGLPDSESSTITTCFVTASHKNTVITIWGSFTQESSQPPKLQVINLEQTSPSYVVDLCFGPAPQDASPPSCFLLVGDRHQGRLMAFHVKSKWNNGEGTQKKALCVGSDYVVPFVQNHPIYSWSVVCSPTTDISEEELQEQAGLVFDMKLFAYQSKAVQCLTLTSYMCLPPEHPWSDSVLGVRIEPLNPQDGPASLKSPDPEELDDVQFDEDYDVDDDDGAANTGDDDGHEVDDQLDIAAPDPNSLPAPDMNDVTAGLPGLNTNPFANWLGAIAAQGSTNGNNGNNAPSKQKPPSLPPGLAPAPSAVTSPIGIPPPPSTTTSASTSPPPGLANDRDVSASRASSQPQALLSPLDLLKSVAPTATVTAAAAPAKLDPSPETPSSAPASAKKESKKKKSGRSSSPKSKKGKTSAVKSSPFPDGKISILKPNRGDDKTKDAAASAVVAAPSTTVPKDAAAGSIPSASVNDIEDMVVRCLDMQFEKQQTFIISQVKSAVKNEMENYVVPAMQKMIKDSVPSASVLRPIQSSVDRLAQSGVKVNKKDFANAVASSAEEPVKTAVANSVRAVMIPALESIAGQIMSSVIENLPKPPPPDTKTASQVQELSDKLTAMTGLVEKMTAELSELKETVAKSAAASQGMGGPNTASQQQGATAANHVDKVIALKNEIVGLLQQRNYEAAFTKALSASTAEMTVFCCSRMNVNDVLGGQPPALSPTILLCLMQQLGASLASSNKSDFRIEIDWLQEIALTMNASDPTISKHVPGVLQQLVSCINAKMAQGDPNLRRPLQILSQVIRGMQVGR